MTTHAIRNFFTRPIGRRRATDSDDQAAAQGRRWFDRDPWCSILKFWPVIVVIAPILVNWIISVNSIRHEYPRDMKDIKETLTRIENKVDVANSNTVTLAQAFAAHTGKPVNLITVAGGPR